MANSVSVADFSQNAGGQLQVEVDPSFLKVCDPARVVAGLVVPYFLKNGPLVLLNVVSEDTLRKAVESPEEGIAWALSAADSHREDDPLAAERPGPFSPPDG